MVDLDVVTAKLGELADRAERIRGHCPRTADELVRDRDIRDLVAFNLMLGVQACLDIASHLISDEAWAVAPSYGDAFRRLSEHGVILEDLAETLARAAGLRNLVAHGYAGADPEKLFQAAVQAPGDFERFAAEVGAWLGRRSGQRS